MIRKKKKIQVHPTYGSATRELISKLKRTGYVVAFLLFCLFLLLSFLAFLLNWPEYLKALFVGLCSSLGAAIVLTILFNYYLIVDGDTPFNSISSRLETLLEIESRDKPLVTPEKAIFLGLERAKDKLYTTELQGAVSVDMVFLTGRSVIRQNIQALSKALKDGCRIRLLILDPSTINSLPEDVTIGLCPHVQLLTRQVEVIKILSDKIPAKILGNNLEIGFSKSIPTAHCVIIKNQYKRRVEYTPYMQQMAIENSLRFEFVIDIDPHEVQDVPTEFEQSFDEAWDNRIQAEFNKNILSVVGVWKSGIVSLLDEPKLIWEGKAEFSNI